MANITNLFYSMSINSSKAIKIFILHTFLLYSFTLFSQAMQTKALYVGGGNTGTPNNLNEISLDPVVVLNTSNINLNNQGVIYDIVLDKINDVYIIVGDFNQVGTFPRNNIAVINKDLTVNTDPKFDLLHNNMSINGVIRTVKIYDTPAPLLPPFPTYLQRRIYFGGDFTQVNINSTPHTRNYMFQLSKNSYSGVFTLDNFHPDLDGNVEDIFMKGDTMLIVGAFYGVNASSTFIDRESLAAYDLSNNTLLANYPQFGFFNIRNDQYNDIEEINDTIYLSGALSMGSGGISQLLPNGTINPNFYSYSYHYALCCSSHGSQSLVRLTDSSVVYSFGYSGENVAIFDVTNPGNNTTPTGTSYNNDRDATTYKDKYVYVYADDALRCWRMTDTTRRWTSYLTFNINGNLLINTNVNKNIFRIENRLFLSTPGNVSIGGNFPQGIKVFCLEPMDAESFLFSDTTICPGQDSVLYTLAPVDYATNYKWEYSGQGAIVRTYGGSTYDTIPPGDSYVSDSNSIWLKYDPSFTPGVLTVTPLSECGIASKPLSINITSNPLPQIYAGLDTTLNCKRDSVILIGSSSTSSTTYQWWNPGSILPVVGANNTIYTDTSYIFQVTDSIGCSNFDTVLVTMDTVSPIANSIPLPYDLSCLITSRIFNGTSINTLDSLIWKNNTNSSYINNPITVSNVGTYTFIAIDKINGCADNSQSIVVGLNQVPPHLGIQGYPNYSSVAYLDVISCTVDTLDLYTESSNVNAVTNWTSADSTQLNGSYLEVTSPGTYYITAIDTVNGCSTYKTVLIDADTIKPIPLIFANQITELNCSIDTISLIGGSSSSNTNSYWSGANNYTASTPAIITTPGMYYINVSSVTNGCTNIDSIEVSYDSKILVSLGNDTVSCNQSNVLINSSYIGSSITGLSYNWNNGATTSSSSFTVGLDTMAIVEISGDNSCYGTDTLLISIPPVPTTSISTFKPCGNGSDGQIVISMSTGWSPFTYSIDNGANFQSNPVFNNVPYGSYDIVIKDSLECEYTHLAAITDTSNLPEPLFLVSTNNFVSDTIILIDVSNPPTDSSSWSFPTGIQVLDNNNLAPISILPDTGSYDVTMTGYYGTCDVSITKTIYSADYDSTYATQNNLNGIKAITLYPNPNDGNFTIEVEFFKKQQAVLTIQDISGNPYFYQQYGEVEYITEYISLSNVLTGTYILKVVSEYDSSYFTFVITQ